MAEKKWYVVHTQTGQEAKAKASIQERARVAGLESCFGEILIPEESVMKIVKGKKSTRSRKFFPGYMFINMELNDKTWHLVRGSAKVSHFVGGKTAPPEVSEEEVKRVTEQIETGTQVVKKSVNFSVGDGVKVTDGPFANFSGSVSDISTEKGKVTVLVSIFGRPTPVELDFLQVDKVD